MQLVKKNQKLHNSDSPLLLGDVKIAEEIIEIDEGSFINTQQKLI